MQETWGQFLGWKDALEKEMAAHSSILAWEIPRREEPGGLQSMGWQKSDRTCWLNDNGISLRLMNRCRSSLCEALCLLWHTFNTAVYSSAASFTFCSCGDSRLARGKNLQPPEFFLGFTHNPASASGLTDTHAYIQTFQKPPTDITRLLSSFSSESS